MLLQLFVEPVSQPAQRFLAHQLQRLVVQVILGELQDFLRGRDSRAVFDYGPVKRREQGLHVRSKRDNLFAGWYLNTQPFDFRVVCERDEVHDNDQLAHDLEVLGILERPLLENPGSHSDDFSTGLIVPDCPHERCILGGNSLVMKVDLGFP